MAPRPDIPLAVSFRLAGEAEFAFARDLYLGSTLSLLRALGPCDETEITERFTKAFHRAPAQIVLQAGRDIGWLQVSETDEGLHLHQIHLIETCRNQGIGTQLIRGILERAFRKRVPVSLNVVRGNKATDLYLRLGFQVVGEDHEKLQMRYSPPTTTSDR